MITIRITIKKLFLLVGVFILCYVSLPCYSLNLIRFRNTDAYKMDVDLERGIATIESLSSFDNTFTHDDSCASNPSNYHFTIQIMDYFSANAYPVLKLKLSINTENSFYYFNSITFTVQNKTFTFSEIANKEWFYEYDDYKQQDLIMTFGSDNQDFLQALFDLTSKNDDFSKISLVLHGTKEISTAVDSNFIIKFRNAFLDYATIDGPEYNDNIISTPMKQESVAPDAQVIIHYKDIGGNTVATDTNIICPGGTITEVYAQPNDLKEGFILISDSKQTISTNTSGIQQEVVFFYVCTSNEKQEDTSSSSNVYTSNEKQEDTSSSNNTHSYSSQKSSFTNKYGTSTTKCAYPGCSNYIASSGDTNSCIKHSKTCLQCGKYIDYDASYCTDCLKKAANAVVSSSEKKCVKCSDKAVKLLTVIQPSGETSSFRLCQKHYEQYKREFTSKGWKAY